MKRDTPPSLTGSTEVARTVAAAATHQHAAVLAAAVDEDAADGTRDVGAAAAAPPS